MARRRRTRVLSIRAPHKLATDVIREAKRRQISKQAELKRRLDYYSTAHQTAAQTPETTTTTT